MQALENEQSDFHSLAGRPGGNQMFPSAFSTADWQGNGGLINFDDVTSIKTEPYKKSSARGSAPLTNGSQHHLFSHSQSRESLQNLSARQDYLGELPTESVEG